MQRCKKIGALLHEILRKRQKYGFFPNDQISKLYKIKSIEAITKIQNSPGPLGFWFYFLFSIHCYKTIILRMRAADLKLAMANLGQSTVRAFLKTHAKSSKTRVKSRKNLKQLTHLNSQIDSPKKYPKISQFINKNLNLQSQAPKCTH